MIYSQGVRKLFDSTVIDLFYWTLKKIFDSKVIALFDSTIIELFYFIVTELFDSIVIKLFDSTVIELFDSTLIELSIIRPYSSVSTTHNDPPLHLMGPTCYVISLQSGQAGLEP